MYIWKLKVYQVLYRWLVIQLCKSVVSFILGNDIDDKVFSLPEVVSDPCCDAVQQSLSFSASELVVADSIQGPLKVQQEQCLSASHAH